MAYKDILQKLKNGNLRYSKNYLAQANDDLHIQQIQKQKASLQGQDPKALVLSCADSRVIPELIFDQPLGELFVVRIIGNIVTTEVIASIEYAILNYDIKLVLVLGHENCGAIEASLNDLDSKTQYLESLITPIQQALKNIKTQDLSQCAKANAINSTQMLVKTSTIICEAQKENRVQLLPAFYSLATGLVSFLKLS